MCSGAYDSCSALDFDAVGHGQNGALAAVPSMHAVAMVSPAEPLSCVSLLDTRNGTLLSQACSNDVSMHNVAFDRSTNRLFVSAYHTVRALDMVYEVVNFEQATGTLVQLTELPPTVSVLVGTSTVSPALQALFLAVKVDGDDATHLLQIDYAAHPPTVHAPVRVAPGQLLGVAVDNKQVYAWVDVGVAGQPRVSLGALNVQTGVVVPVQTSPIANLTCVGTFAVDAGTAATVLVTPDAQQAQSWNVQQTGARTSTLGPLVNKIYATVYALVFTPDA